MFGMKKLRKDLPAIDIRKKPVKGFYSKTKLVPATKSEQRKIKKQLMMKYPDCYYMDDLNEWYSIKGRDNLLNDDAEEFDAFMDDN